MSARLARDPSPFRSGLVHGALGAFCLTVVLGAAASAMHLFGDSDAASPMVRVALFDEVPTDAPQLNPRLPGYQDTNRFADAGRPAASGPADRAEPDLGVEYAASAGAPATRPQTERAKGIRINGETVLPGQTYSQVAQNAKSSSSVVAVNSEPAQPDIAPTSPLVKYAAAFTNPENKPTVSIIVGGLGINASRTRAAINELPPEVTLSFAPTSDDLGRWVSQARRAGHEVLIEVPMEPYDYGRQRPHALVMQIAVSPETNKQRMNRLLSRTSGYIGVMNYQGAKFATEENAVLPILQELRSKGLAFFEDGSLVRSKFDEGARASGVAFGQTTAWIDARPEGDEISKQFLVLETAALEQGAALGTGMSFPVTLDLLKEWLPTLDEKGILLAPASHYAKRSRIPVQNVQAGIDPQG